MAETGNHLGHPPARLLPPLLMVLLLAPVMLSGAGADGAVDRGCVVQAGATASAGLLLVDAGAGDSSLQASCVGGSLDELIVSLPPRGEVDVTLILPRGTTGVVHAGADWLVVEADDGATLKLVLQAVPALAPGSIHAVRLELLLDDGQGERLLVIPVQLRVQDEESLFRSRFEVDPVLGQFS